MKRGNGRKPGELRPVKIVPDYSEFAEGSVLFQQGLTSVLCNASILPGVPDWKERQGTPGGWITAEYAMLPRATNVRSPRETAGPRARSQEIKRLIGRSLRASVNLGSLGIRTIIVDCDVLQADGGTRTASITGGYLALAMALKRLVESGDVSEDVFLSGVAAVSVGLVQNHALLDLDYTEDSAAQVDMNVVMNRDLDFIEVQASAEGSPFSNNFLVEMLDLATAGIKKLSEIQFKTLEKWHP